MKDVLIGKRSAVNWMSNQEYLSIVLMGGSRGQEIETILANTVKPRLY